MTGEMACARCGRRVPVRFGVMSRRCACGAEFEWAPFGGAGRVAAFLMALALLMSPLLVLVWIVRSLLQDSIVLYVIALAAALYWLRVCERCSCVLACCAWRASMRRDRCGVPN